MQVGGRLVEVAKAEELTKAVSFVSFSSSIEKDIQIE